MKRDLTKESFVDMAADDLLNDIWGEAESIVRNASRDLLAQAEKHMSNIKLSNDVMAVNYVVKGLLADQLKRNPNNIALRMIVNAVFPDDDIRKFL